MLRMASVQPSLTRSTSCGTPAVRETKLRRRSFCQPGFSDFAHAGSVGAFRRSSTDAGGGWSTQRCLADPAVCVPSGVVVVPPARVEGVALELVDPRYTRQLRLVQRPVGLDDELSLDRVSAVRLDLPFGFFLQPTHLGDLSLE